MPAADRVAYLVHYSGRVQGVGFRHTARVLARDHPVAGWVKNLPDGRVRLLAEGAESDVLAFLERVTNHWGLSIRDEQRERVEPTGESGGFAVTR